MWVPWRGGHTAREQARLRSQREARKAARGKPKRGREPHPAAVAKARAAHRKQALKALRAGKLTPAQYRKRLREIG